MAKKRIPIGNEIEYRLIKANSNGLFNLQIKKWWGWTTLKSDEDGSKMSFKCENDADYWMKVRNPYSFLNRRA